jgi:putative flippase GtrA
MIASEQTKAPLTQNKDVRQFIKFCIVGGSSMAVNAFFINVFIYWLHTPYILAITASFILSVFNGFIWNRRWTFKNSRQQAVHDQYVRFLLVNIVGWFLSTIISVAVTAHLASAAGNLPFHTVAMQIITGSAKTMYPRWIVYTAMLVSAVVVVFWNFFANRKWTFKHG